MLKLLSTEQNKLSFEFAQDLLDIINPKSEFLIIVITKNESWICVYDLETKTQSSQWKHPRSPRPETMRQEQNKIKVTLIIFFNIPVGLCIPNDKQWQSRAQSIPLRSQWYNSPLKISGRRKTESCIWKCPQHIHNTSIRSSWWNMKFQSFINFSTFQAWVLATFGCF